MKATPQPLEGSADLASLVLIQFPDVDTARAWYDSEEYQPWKLLRQASARVDAVLLEAPDVG